MLKLFKKASLGYMLHNNASFAVIVAFICGIGYQRFALTNSYVSPLLLIEQAGFYYTSQQEQQLVKQAYSENKMYNYEKDFYNWF